MMDPDSLVFPSPRALTPLHPAPPVPFSSPPAIVFAGAALQEGRRARPPRSLLVGLSFSSPSSSSPVRAQFALRALAPLRAIEESASSLPVYGLSPVRLLHCPRQWRRHGRLVFAPPLARSQPPTIASRFGSFRSLRPRCLRTSTHGWGCRGWRCGCDDGSRFAHPPSARLAPRTLAPSHRRHGRVLFSLPASRVPCRASVDVEVRAARGDGAAGTMMGPHSLFARSHPRAIRESASSLPAYGPWRCGGARCVRSATAYRDRRRRDREEGQDTKIDVIRHRRRERSTLVRTDSGQEGGRC
jgi:hypothetical protein